jgi:myo-inositol-1(or 4)-monophosphatase
MPNPSELAQLIDAIKRAGAFLMSQWPASYSAQGHLQVQEKADGTLVTKADIESNRILVEALSNLFPNDAILSEESEPDLLGIFQSKRTWIIDPLDGTKSFVAGRDDFSVLVALVENGVPTLGIMFFPARQLLITSQSGTAPMCNGSPISVSKADTLKQGRIYIRNFECRRPELAAPMMDSGLALLKVACGELDGAVIKMTTHRQWDIAAPSAVLLASGGAVSDETGAQISFKPGPLGYNYYIASNGKIQQLLQGLI